MQRLLAAICLFTATAASAQTTIQLKTPKIGDDKLVGFVLPAPKESPTLVVELHDVSNPVAPVFLDRRTAGKVNPDTGAFEATLGGPLGPLVRIRVSQTGGTLSAEVTTPKLADPVLRSSLHDGSRVIEGMLPDKPVGVNGVRIQVGRSTLENTLDVSAYEQSKTSRDVAEDGTFSVTLSRPLIAGQVVVAEALMGNSAVGKSVPITVTDPGSWGRARAYFATGVVFSKDREDFSKQDLALTFAIDKGWLQRPDYTLGAESAVKRAVDAEAAARGAASDRTKANANGAWTFRQLNTFLDARLTALPVEAAADEGEGGEGGDAAEATPTFVDSKKSALMQVGIYAPIYGPQTSWVHDGAVNAFFVAPLFRIGIQTITSEIDEDDPDDVHNFYSFGFGIGHHKLSGSTNQTPEVVSYLHLSWGKAEAFERTIGTATKRPWRTFVEGRLKIPETALHVGFDANLGDGKDDIRFVFGTRFDVGELFARLSKFE